MPPTPSTSSGTSNRTSPRRATSWTS